MSFSEYFITDIFYPSRLIWLNFELRRTIYKFIFPDLEHDPVFGYLLLNTPFCTCKISTGSFLSWKFVSLPLPSNASGDVVIHRRWTRLDALCDGYLFVVVLYSIHAWSIGILATFSVMVFIQTLWEIMFLGNKYIRKYCPLSVDFGLSINLLAAK